MAGRRRTRSPAQRRGICPDDSRPATGRGAPAKAKAKAGLVALAPSSIRVSGSSAGGQHPGAPDAALSRSAASRRGLTAEGRSSGPSMARMGSANPHGKATRTAPRSWRRWADSEPTASMVPAQPLGAGRTLATAVLQHLAQPDATITQGCPQGSSHERNAPPCMWWSTKRRRQESASRRRRPITARERAELNPPDPAPSHLPRSPVPEEVDAGGWPHAAKPRDTDADGGAGPLLESRAAGVRGHTIAAISEDAGTPPRRTISPLASGSGRAKAVAATKD